MTFDKFMHIERYGTEEVEGINIGECLVMAKLDGSNGSLWLNDDGELRAGSRNRELTLDNDNQGFYAYVLSEPKFKKYLEKYPTRRLYGEWLVKHCVTYRQEAWRKFYIFDVMELNDNGCPYYMPYNEYQPSLEEFELDYIDPLAILTNPTEEMLVSYLDKNTYLMPDAAGPGEGCFKSNMRVLMADETQKPIKQVKIGDLVKSYNEKTGRIENKTVTNIFMNGKKEKSLWGKYASGIGKSYKIGIPDSHMIYATKNHQIWNGNGYSSISEAKEFYQYDYVITDEIKQALLGLLLSDGSLDKRNNILIIAQKNNERGKSLYKLFEPISNKPYIHLSGKGSEMISFTITKRFTCEWLSKYQNLDGTKNIPALIDGLNHIGFAFFYMGDGCTYKNSDSMAEIATHSFSIEEIQLMKEKIYELYGEYPTEHKDNRVDLTKNSGISLRFPASLRDKFEILSGKYFLDGFRYKIKNTHEWYNFIIEKGLVSNRITYSAEVDDNSKQWLRCSGFEAYDIEVEDNHNYFIEKTLVHNCVIKNYEFHNKYGRPCYAKIVRNEFKERARKVHGFARAEGNPIEEKIAETYITGSLVEKELAKLINECGGWNSKMIPRLLQTIWHEFLVEESYNMVKKFKNPTIDFKALNSFVTREIKRLKPELF